MTAPETVGVPVLQSLVPDAAACDDDVCVVPGEAREVAARADDDRN